MSARREKRFRQLERRVDAAEFVIDKMEKRLSRAENNVADMARIRAEIKVQDADWAPAPPRRGLWRRLLDAIKGRDEP